MNKMETIYIVLHKSKHGKRHTAVAAYRDEEDARNEQRAIDDHTSGRLGAGRRGDARRGGQCERAHRPRRLQPEGP